VSAAGAPPNWYPDPSGSGGLRWWDGWAWSEHVAVQPVYVPMPLPWKGYQIGRPARGPGSLADPGKRVAAWFIDAAFFLVVFAVMLTVVLLIAAPHFGPIFPQVPANDPNAKVPFPGFFWIDVCAFACAFVTSILMVAYQTVATAVYGRSFGKKLLRIRPVRTSDLSGLGWGRAFGRSAILWVALAIGSWLGLFVPAWCIWDDKRQGLHDKAVDSIVIEDLPAPPVLA
jgi:uncharacterized RDD family membrane protein YckC